MRRTLNGLSPRLRGNLLDSHLQRLWPRSIPAPAGEPLGGAGGGWGVTVYPRACGGTAQVKPEPDYASGLSPRLRGNPSSAVRAYGRDGSIPAPAGEPLSTSMGRPGCMVYPRACGGTGLRGGGAVAACGLSPRLRGNRDLTGGKYSCERSIPAPAGEPRPTYPWARGKRVYPRACGGTLSREQRAAAAAGLSPRLRGNRVNGARAVGETRSIPAPAGEPQMSEPDASPVEGLSPRLRGNQRQMMPNRIHVGSIPAPAGEPIPGICSGQLVLQRRVVW